MVKPLIDLVTKHNMHITLPPDIPTYETVMSNWTHPDNIWHNNNTLNPTEVSVGFASILLRFNLVRVEIRELRPEVVAESDEVLIHYRSRTNV